MFFFHLNSNYDYVIIFLIISVLVLFLVITLFFNLFVNFLFVNFFSSGNGSVNNVTMDCSSFGSNPNSDKDRNSSFFKKYKNYIVGFSFLVILGFSVYYLSTLDVAPSMSNIGSAYELSRAGSTDQVQDLSTDQDNVNLSTTYTSLRDFLEVHTDQTYPTCECFSNRKLNLMVNMFASSFSDFKLVFYNSSGVSINNNSSEEELNEAFLKTTSRVFELMADKSPEVDTKENRIMFEQQLRAIFRFYMKRN